MMESITIYPKNEKQKSLLESLLAEMKVRFKVQSDETEMSEEEFFAKIDKSIDDIKKGKGIKYTPELRDELFESIL